MSFLLAFYKLSENKKADFLGLVWLICECVCGSLGMGADRMHSCRQISTVLTSGKLTFLERSLERRLQ